MANNQFNNLDVPPVVRKLLQNWRKVLAGIALFIIAWSAFFQVEPEEAGGINRFGKYIRKVDPGLNLKIPLLEKVQKVAVERQQKLEFGFRSTQGGMRTEYSREGVES